MMFLELSLIPWRVFGAAAAWPVASQQQARRNALVSTTALAEQRRERLDVEDYLAARIPVQRAGQRAGRRDGSPTSRHTA
jgi:hypothetical protein